MRLIDLRCLPAVGVLLACSALGSTQSQPAPTPPAQAQSTSQAKSTSGTASPLAAAARNAKAQKTAHAKKVFTDDDMEVSAGPLPLLKMDGAENGDDVLAAITKYKQTHTPEQTEQAVHGWYDRYDEMLVAAIQENKDMAALNSANMSNGNELCQQSQDYQQCQNRQMADQRGNRSDQTEMIKNTALMMRIQRVFLKIRGGLQMNNLHYSWFRIQSNSYNGDDL
ncbi:MAG TPA: hypothetical protein VMD99_18400 [Terriglobales bacterium]|nr:hypothetical protein [Terriglobales bacterium]